MYIEEHRTLCYSSPKLVFNVAITHLYSENYFTLKHSYCFTALPALASATHSTYSSYFTAYDQ